jgi:predicted PurR-regulated permease PerM
MKKTRADRENSELLKIVGGIVVIATLYFARVVFIPLALAWLFSLLLIPPVSFIERINSTAQLSYRR